MGTKKIFLEGYLHDFVAIFLLTPSPIDGISRDGIGLKVTEIAQTDTHSAFKTEFLRPFKVVEPGAKNFFLVY